MSDNPGSSRLKGPAGIVLAICLIAVAVLLMKSRHEAHERDLGESGRPILFVLSPDHGRQVTPNQRAVLADFLRKESGFNVEVYVAETPLDAIEAFGGGPRVEADMGILNLFEYTLARNEYKVEAARQVLRKGSSTGYAGVIVVRSDGLIRDLAGLGGKTIAYTDPFSTSGFVFAARSLADAGVNLRHVFAGNHEQAVAQLRAGQVDAAATYDAMVRNDPSFRIIARTDTIPNEPVFFRSGLRPDKRDRLAAAIDRFAKSSDGPAILSAVADIEGFRAITDLHYAPVLETARAAGRSVYQLVPEGLRVESRRRGIMYGP